MRQFDYTDPLFTNLRPYHLSAAPLVAVQGEVYLLPFLGIRSLPVVDFGITVAYARAVGLQSTVAGSDGLSTQWSRYHVGGRARARLGGAEGSPIVAGLSGVYGNEAFTFGSALNMPLPSVSYQLVRVSGDARVPFGRAALYGNLGYAFVLSPGDVGSRFPRGKTGGVEVEVGGAYGIATGVEARLTASYRRFFYTMNASPGDAYVAGGALDQLGGLQASIAYIY